MCPSGTSLASGTTAKSDFRSAFEILDADRDGKISTEDLRAFYKSGFSSGHDDDEIIGSMMAVADSNEDGFVEYDEFERVLGGGSSSVAGGQRRRSSSSLNGIMEDVFKVMDKDGDGKLSHGDLKSYMQWAGFDASDDDIKAMIRLAAGGGDDEKDGVSLDDLLKILAVDFGC